MNRITRDYIEAKEQKIREEGLHPALEMDTIWKLKKATYDKMKYKALNANRRQLKANIQYLKDTFGLNKYTAISRKFNLETGMGLSRGNIIKIMGNNLESTTQFWEFSHLFGYVFDIEPMCLLSEDISVYFDRGVKPPQYPYAPE